jgi:hypothetical protein
VVHAHAMRCHVMLCYAGAGAGAVHVRVSGEGGRWRGEYLDRDTFLGDAERNKEWI